MYIFILFISTIISMVEGSGLLLLYRPKDISKSCAYSQHLRFDLSYGMGMSDTITLVLRTLTELDYQCLVEIVTEPWANLIIVIKFPINLRVSCNTNMDTITVLKKNKCLRVCDLTTDRDQLSPYFVASVRGRFRFWFKSNSSSDSDGKSTVYQVTATSARQAPRFGCFPSNETSCVVDYVDYCLTSGVVCDGINNCGVQDWFDERKSECGLTVEKLGFAPVIAILAAIFCALLAAGHTLLRCLPPLANSYFIFNANEDNRLYIDPVLGPPTTRPISLEEVKRTSLIPVSLTSSSGSSHDQEKSDVIAQTLQSLSITREPSRLPNEQSRKEPENEPVNIPTNNRKSTIRNMAERLQKKFRKDKVPTQLKDV